MAHEPDSNPDTAVRNRLGRSIRVLWIGITTVLIASMPAAAFRDELGNTIGASGGEMGAWIFWFALLLAAMYVGGLRTGKALSDCGSVHEDKRKRGHEEIVPALATLIGGVVLVIAASTFFSRMMPESWSWLGVDLASYVNIPGVGGDGSGDSGSAATQSASADPGTIYSPELTDVMVDVSLHATDVVMVLF